MHTPNIQGTQYTSQLNNQENKVSFPNMGLQTF